MSIKKARLDFIETNGRLWGSLPLAVASGANFPLYLYEMLVEGRTKFQTPYKCGVYCRNLTLDLSWFKKKWKADGNDPMQQIVPLGRAIGELGNVLTLSEHVDTLSLDDPMPFFTEGGVLLARARGALSTRASDAFGLTALVKQRRAKRALTKICGGANNVLFVCFGNICRSPFAEAYARSIAPRHIVFTSAGSFGRADQVVPYEARSAAAGFGINLERHRSKALSAEMIATCDVTVVFDWQNRQEVTRRFPEAETRVVRLGDFLPGTDDEIADPFGKPEEHFRLCYLKISTALNRIVC